MKRAVLMTALLFLCPAWSALGQQSDQDWHPFQEQKQKQAQSAGPLSNDSIVKLVKAGLGEDTIISMVNTQPGKYSLGADDIIALKKAGVSEKIITAMLNRPFAATVAAPAEPAGSITEVGVYYKKGDEWVQVMPEVVNWKTGGVLKSVATVGLFPSNLKGDCHPN